MPHAPTFLVEVSIKNVGAAKGEGTTKQEAETVAAKVLLGKLK
jgi:dsRNA-specific ribonuclease